MKISLTEEDLARMGLSVSGGRVDADVDVASVLPRIAQRTDLVRARTLVEACHDEKVREEALKALAGETNPEGAAPPPGGTSHAGEASPSGETSDTGDASPGGEAASQGESDDTAAAGASGGSAEDQLLSRILGQIRDLETSNGERVEKRLDAVGLQAELDALELKGGPADAVALHDFHVLQIAFKHVWTEAFDESLRASVEQLYAAAVQLSEEQGFDFPEAEAITEVNQLNDFIAKIRGEAEHLARVIPVPSNVARWFPEVTPAIWNSLSGGPDGQQQSLRNYAHDLDLDPHAAGTHPDIRRWLDHPQGTLGRLEKLMLEIGRLLSEPYAFHIFAPNSYNFGILSTYRQRWEPVAYQAGDLVATIPLAPGETRKYTERVAVRKSRSEREVEKSLSSRREESAQTSRADTEIVRKASTATNFKQSAEGSFSIGIVGLSGTTDFAHNQENESANVKKDFREAVVRAAQDYSKERTIEVTTSASEDRDTSTSGELTNPNNEISVTYLLYQLQRRYRITEYLNRLTPVILVAQDVPAPHEIDEAWLLSQEWILKRVLLDDSLRPALEYLKEGFTGDELSLQVKKANWEKQRDLVANLETSLNQQLSARNALRGAIAGNVLDQGELAAGETSLVQDIVMTAATGGLNLFGSGPDQAEILKAKRKALEMTLGYADETVKEVQQKMIRALETLAQTSDDLTRAFERQSGKRTAVDQLRIHVKENILYYMQAVWAHEPPDQRFFRLYDLDILWVPDPIGSIRLVGAVQVGNRQMFHLVGDGIDVILPTPQIPAGSRKLADVADLDNFIGFKGNYLMFPLKESCYLTTFMMQEFVDDYLGVRDPDPFGTYTTEELLEYIECVYHHNDTTDEDRAILKQMLIDRLTSPRRDKEEIIVPTGKLFIEALPGKHPLLEDFKLLHRAMDVKKVRAENREAELENLRRAARLIAGEREDPDIDKRVLVQGGAAVVTEPG